MFPQLDNPDEQAAQIRRELDGRLQMADQIARVTDAGVMDGLISFKINETEMISE